MQSLMQKLQNLSALQTPRLYRGQYALDKSAAANTVTPESVLPPQFGESRVVDRTEVDDVDLGVIAPGSQSNCFIQPSV